MKQISIQALLDDLSNGLTRTVSGKGYDSTLGSIEEKYELTKAEVKDIFQHPLLANKMMLLLTLKHLLLLLHMEHNQELLQVF